LRHPETGLWSHEPATQIPCEKSFEELNRVVDWIVKTATSREPDSKLVFVAEQNTMVSEEDSDFSRSFQNAVQYALDSKFKENRAVQEEALFKFIQRNDVFSVLTTGCGKSLIFQRVTIVCSYLYYHGFKYSMLHWLLFARRVL